MRERIRAGMLHLGVTVVALMVVSVVALVFWYPPPYREILGAGRILALVALSAVVIGPVLTAVVYRPGKKGLAFDLWVIAAAQLAALGVGIGLLYQERPWFMVYAVDRFNVLASRDVDFDSIQDDRFLDKPVSGPMLLIARMPEDPAERQRLMEETLFLGLPDLERRPAHWVPYDSAYREVVGGAASLSDLRDARPKAEASIDRFVEGVKVAESNLITIPVIGKRRDFATVVDRESGEIVGVIAVDPWFE